MVAKESSISHYLNLSICAQTPNSSVRIIYNKYHNLHRCSRWSLEKTIYLILYNGRNYLSMLGLKSIHVCKRGFRVRSGLKHIYARMVCHHLSRKWVITLTALKITRINADTLAIGPVGTNLCDTYINVRSYFSNKCIVYTLSPRSTFTWDLVVSMLCPLSCEK